jgi:hypothetical protein
MLKRATLLFAAIAALSGCPASLEELPAGDQLTCSAEAPQCPEGWKCDLDVGHCFLGGVPNVPGIRASPRSITTAEDGPTGSDTLSVTLLTEPTAPVTVQLSSSDPSEGRPALDTLTFTPADWSTAQVVRIIGIDDDVVDGDQSYRILIGPVSSADSRYAQLATTEVAAVNLDRDTAQLVVASAPSLLTTESGGSATFSVRLSAEPAAEVVVPIATSAPGEVSLSTTELRFNAGNWNVPVPVLASGVDDSPPTRDGDVPFMIALGPTSSADPAFARLTAQVAGVNADNDVAGFLVDAAGGVVVSESGTQDTFTVRLRTRPLAPVSVQLDSIPAGKVAVSPATVVLDGTNWDTGVVVTVTGLEDSPPVDDADAVVTIRLLPATSADPAYNGVDPDDVQATALDDDTSALVFSPNGGFVVSEGGVSTTLKVHLATQPSANVTITASTSPTSEATISPSTRTFTPANWDQDQAFTISGVDDSPPVADGTRTFTVNVSVSASADPNYAALAAAALPGVNLDNDVARIVLSTTQAVAANEGQTIKVADVSLSTQPVAAVTVDVSSTNPSRGTPSPLHLNFDSSNWNVAQTVSFVATDNNLRDQDSTFQINFSGSMASADLAYRGLTAGPIQLTVFDDERYIALDRTRVQGDVGVDNADHICATENSSASFRALLANPGRAPGQLGWVLTAGRNYLRKSDGAVLGRAASGGLLLTTQNVTTATPDQYWTGLDDLGGPPPTGWQASATCNGWTSNSSSFIGGTGIGNDTTRGFSAGDTSCNASQFFLCVEQ